MSKMEEEGENGPRRGGNEGGGGIDQDTCFKDTRITFYAFVFYILRACFPLIFLHVHGLERFGNRE